MPTALAAFSICHLFRLQGDTFVLWHQCKMRHPLCLSKWDDGYHFVASVFPTSIYFGTQVVTVYYWYAWGYKGFVISGHLMLLSVSVYHCNRTVVNSKLSGFNNLNVALKAALRQMYSKALRFISVYSNTFFHTGNYSSVRWSSSFSTLD